MPDGLTSSLSSKSSSNWNCPNSGLSAIINGKLVTYLLKILYTKIRSLSSTTTLNQVKICSVEVWQTGNRSVVHAQRPIFERRLLVTSRSPDRRVESICQTWFSPQKLPRASFQSFFGVEGSFMYRFAGNFMGRMLAWGGLDGELWNIH